jgi:hypothetical protein
MCDGYFVADMADTNALLWLSPIKAPQARNHSSPSQLMIALTSATQSHLQLRLIW